MKEEEWRAALEKIICIQMKEQKMDRVSVINAMEENLKGKRHRELTILVNLKTRIDILREMRTVTEEEKRGGAKI